MNKRFVVALVALGLVGVLARAQFVQGPLTGSAIAVSGYVIAQGSTSNIPPADANLIPIGNNGVGICATISGGEEAVTTNAVIRFELSSDGVNWIDNVTPAYSVPMNTTDGQTDHTSFTNFQKTVVNFSNARYMRIASIQNTNVGGATESITFSSIVWSIKE